MDLVIQDRLKSWRGILLIFVENLQEANESKRLPLLEMIQNCSIAVNHFFIPILGPVLSAVISGSPQNVEAIIARLLKEMDVVPLQLDRMRTPSLIIWQSKSIQRLDTKIHIEIGHERINRIYQEEDLNEEEQRLAEIWLGSRQTTGPLKVKQGAPTIILSSLTAPRKKKVQNALSKIIFEANRQVPSF